jgi:excisionase family DNA binding protein
MALRDALAASKTKDPDDPWLSVAEAVKLLGYSRPYVSMLIDNDRIPGACMSEDNCVRVPRSAVLEYRAKREAEKKNRSADYRAAARDAGMYSVSDRELVLMGRRTDSGPLLAPLVESSKTDNTSLDIDDNVLAVARSRAALGSTTTDSAPTTRSVLPLLPTTASVQPVTLELVNHLRDETP